MATTILMNAGLERSLIHSLLWTEPTDFLEVTNGLSGECFSERLMGELFEVLKERYLNHKPLTDMVMVAQNMVERGHKDFTMQDLFTLSQETTIFQDLREYVLTVINMHQRRELQRLFYNMQLQIEDLTSDVPLLVSKTIDSMLGNVGMGSDQTIQLSNVLIDLQQRIDDNRQGITKTGLLTGFERLDRYGGLHQGDLVIIAADSSQGKSSLAINILVNAVRESQAKAVVFSMEMSALQLGARILSPETNFPASVIMYRKLTDNSYREALEGISNLQRDADHIFFGDASLQTISAICSSIRLHHARFGVNMVVVDYLQIIAHEQRWNVKNEEALAEAARKLKNLAKELGIVVLLLSQLNRDGASMGNNVPSASRLRGSGQINEAADLTVLIYRPEVYGGSYPAPFQNEETKGTAMLKIDKDRNGSYGGIGMFLVGFDGKTTKFKPLPPDPSNLTPLAFRRGVGGEAEGSLNSSR